jgi:hypothetical protein
VAIVVFVRENFIGSAQGVIIGRRTHQDVVKAWLLVVHQCKFVNKIVIKFACIKRLK